MSLQIPRAGSNIMRWSADDVTQWIFANTDKFGLNQEDLESIADDPVTGAQLIGKDDEELSQHWALSIHAANKIVKKAQQMQRKTDKRNSEPIISVMNGNTHQVINLGDIQESNGHNNPHHLHPLGPLRSAPLQTIHSIPIGSNHSRSNHYQQHHYGSDRNGNGSGSGSGSGSNRHSRRSSLNQIPEAPTPSPGPFTRQWTQFNGTIPPYKGPYGAPHPRHGAAVHSYWNQMQMQQYAMAQMHQQLTSLTVTIHNDTFMGRLSHPKWWMDGHFDHIPNKIGSRDAVSIQISGDSDTPLVGLLAFTLRLDPRLIVTRHQQSRNRHGHGHENQLNEHHRIPPWMVGPGGLPFLPPSVGRLYEVQQEYLQKVAVNEESRLLRKQERVRAKQQKEDYKRLKEEQREVRREEKREERRRRRLEKERKSQNDGDDPLKLEMDDQVSSLTTPVPVTPGTASSAKSPGADSENEGNQNQQTIREKSVSIRTTAVTFSPSRSGVALSPDPYNALDQQSVIVNESESEESSSSEEEDESSDSSHSTELSDLDDEVEIEEPPKYRLIILWSITAQREVEKTGKFDRRDDIVRNSVMTSVASSDLLNSMNRFNVLLLEDDTNDENDFNLDNQYFNEMESAAQIADVEQCLVEHEHFEIAATFGTKQWDNSYTLTIDIDDALGDWPGPLHQPVPNGHGGFEASMDFDLSHGFASGGVGGGSAVRNLFDHPSQRNVTRVTRSQSQPPQPLGFTTDVAHGILSVEPPHMRPPLSSKMFTLSDIVQEARTPRDSGHGPKLGRFTSLPSYPIRTDRHASYVLMW